MNKERRPKSRKRVLYRGRIVYAEGQGHFDCPIRDLTDAGARIALRGQPIPSSVYLINLSDRTVHKARVVWNDGREAGLQFQSSVALADIIDPGLAYLKKLAP